MEVDIMTGVKSDYTENYNKPECIVEKISKKATTNEAVKNHTEQKKEEDKAGEMKGKKDSTEKQIKAALEQANHQAKMKQTACEFTYDEDTKRISITVKDKDTDEIIREIPGEETLEMISRIWELAGILIDERR
ncbi:MAG: flagellar protein FlaG [Clostridiales bacterium]|nr:flagellar protein FlaG [Clostridiales bacterium]